MAEQLVDIASGPLAARVSSMGAQLMGLTLEGEQYLWQGDPRWWPRRAPVLFPIVGTLRGGRAESAQGPVTLGRHGLARNLEHEIAEKAADSVTFALRSNDETRKAYPFDFLLNMCYRIVDGALEQVFLVTNTGEVALPFTLGGHPAFNVPAPEDAGGRFSDWSLRFARPWTASSPALDLESGLWDFSRRVPVLDNSDTLPLSHELFSVDTLCFEDVPERTVRLEGPNGHGVELDFDGFDYLGVWSAPDAPFVALEPWQGCSTAADEDDVFEHKRKTMLLAPGEKKRLSFSIRPF